MNASVEPSAQGAGLLPGVKRLVNADARAALEQIKASPMMAEGKVSLIALDAIRARLGGRWLGRSERVFEYVQTSLRKQVGPHGFFLRVSETDYVVAQPNVSRLAGQAYCLNCLREVLTFFLGEALVSDIVVHEVLAIEGGVIGARKLDTDEVQAQAEREVVERRRESAAAAPNLMSQDRWSPFTATDGRRLRASSQLDPVFQLKTYGRIGYRMTRRTLLAPGDTPLTPAEHGQLTSADIERIDFATLARGFNRLQQQTAGEREPSLILPVSFATLSSHRGRKMLAEFFRAAQENVQRGLICEVCDIEGVPPGAMLAATALIRPHCLFIVGRLNDAPQGGLAYLKDVGLHGVSIECPPGAESDDGFAHLARVVTTAAKGIVRAVMLYGVSGPRQAAMASLYGATHASFAPAEARALAHA
jgi:hypothetical protein